MLADPRRVRFSHIVPDYIHPFKAIAFRLLRLLFGEKGRVADWTRAWQCMWVCVILIGPHAGKRSVSKDRAKLIKWEKEVWKWQRVPELWNN